MTICERTTATAPTAHHQRGARNSAPAVTQQSAAAASQTRPAGWEIGWVSAENSANPKAVAKPMNRMRPCTTNSAAVAVRIKVRVRVRFDVGFEVERVEVRVELWIMVRSRSG